MDLGDLLVQLPHLIDEEMEMGGSEGPGCSKSDLQTDWAGTQSLQQLAWCVVHQSCLASSYLIPENWSVLERALDWHWENQDFNISSLIFISSFSGLLLSPPNMNVTVNVDARRYSQRRRQASAKAATLAIPQSLRFSPNSAQIQCWWGGTWCSVTLNILSDLVEPKLHWTVVVTMWARAAYKA